MKKLTAKRLILLILALLIIAAACWFTIPRQVLHSGEELQIPSQLWRNGKLSDISDTDADTLAAAIGGLHYHPCFMESIPNTFPDWDLTFTTDNGSFYRIEVYSDDMVILYSHSISYRVTDAAPLLEALGAIG